jgi:hypothetical protein
LLLPDFVKSVFPNFPNLLEAAKEILIDLCGHSFVWSNYSIIDTEIIQELAGIRRTDVHAFDFTFTSQKFEPMRPNVSGITHERAAPGKKHGSVVYRRVND